MTNEELVTAYQRGQDISPLWQQSRKFIFKIANEYKNMGADIEDLTQAGFIGLVSAADKFQPDRGIKFLTYAEHWIRAEIRKELDRCSNAPYMPADLRTLIRKYKRTVAKLQAQGVEPTSDRISDVLSISIAEVEQLQAYAVKTAVKSLEEPTKADDESISLADAIPDNTDIEMDIISRHDFHQMQNVLWSLVDNLPALEASVIRERYKNNNTLVMTAEVLHSTKSKVENAERKAMRELRKDENKSLLAEYYNLYIGCSKTAVNAKYERTDYQSITERRAIKHLCCHF